MEDLNTQADIQEKEVLTPEADEALALEEKEAIAPKEDKTSTQNNAESITQEADTSTPTENSQQENTVDSPVLTDEQYFDTLSIEEIEQILLNEMEKATSPFYKNQITELLGCINYAKQDKNKIPVVKNLIKAIYFEPESLVLEGKQENPALNTLNRQDYIKDLLQNLYGIDLNALEDEESAYRAWAIYNNLQYNPYLQSLELLYNNMMLQQEYEFSQEELEQIDFMIQCVKDYFQSEEYLLLSDKQKLELEMTQFGIPDDYVTPDGFLLTEGLEKVAIGINDPKNPDGLHPNIKQMDEFNELGVCFNKKQHDIKQINILIRQIRQYKNSQDYFGLSDEKREELETTSRLGVPENYSMPYTDYDIPSVIKRAIKGVNEPTKDDAIIPSFEQIRELRSLGVCFNDKDLEAKQNNNTPEYTPEQQDDAYTSFAQDIEEIKENAEFDIKNNTKETSQDSINQTQKDKKQDNKTDTKQNASKTVSEPTVTLEHERTR